MVGTRRRSVNPSVAAEVSSPATTEKSTPRGRKSAEKSEAVDKTPGPQNNRLAELKSSARATRQKASSPAKSTAQETDSKKIVNPTPSTTPRGRRKAVESPVVESSKTEELPVPDTAITTRSRSPQKSSARSETPTRGKRVSESSARPETPTRGKRVSESEGRPGTPSRLKVDALPVTSSRKSRRLSGSAPEHIDSPLVPLKKRRSSFMLNDEVYTDDAKAKDTSLAVIQESSTESEVNQTKKVDIPNIVVDSVETTEETKVEQDIQKEESEEVGDISENQVEVQEAVRETEENQSTAENKENEESVEMVSVDQESKETDEKKEITTDQKDVADETNEKQKENVEKKFISVEDRLLEQIRNQILIKKIPRQKPKSGKFWKGEREQFRQIKKDKGPRKTFEERMRMKEEKQRSNEMASMVLQEKIAKKQELRRRIEENKKLKEQRQLKNEIFQVVKNPNKIKRMKKRDLAKRDILGKV